MEVSLTTEDGAARAGVGFSPSTLEVFTEGRARAPIGASACMEEEVGEGSGAADCAHPLSGVLARKRNRATERRREREIVAAGNERGVSTEEGNMLEIWAVGLVLSVCALMSFFRSKSFWPTQNLSASLAKAEEWKPPAGT
ncbi:hypothetical protein AD948_14215 [Acetobacter senegalensis]|uniref:Uncharacterized protein n=1 Tax=Acetobacter senegalensis TaxID=446692 RepID=A0A149TW80_9PROT|nr:hypothetical protein AD948_14215 [Acetobacter senegalensis]